MSKTKKMTFNMVASKAKKQEPVALTLEWMDGKTIYVQPRLTLDEAMSFVDNVAGSCFDSTTGEYTPEILEFVTYINTLVCYAGFDAPTDLKKAYRAVYETPIMKEVTECIDGEQYMELIDAIEEKLKYMVNASVATAGKQVSDAVVKLNSIIEEGNAAMDHMQSPEFTQAMQRMAEIGGMNNPTADSGRIVDMITKAPVMRVVDDE